MKAGSSSLHNVPGAGISMEGGKGMMKGWMNVGSGGQVSHENTTIILYCHWRSVFKDSHICSSIIISNCRLFLFPGR